MYEISSEAIKGWIKIIPSWRLQSIMRYMKIIVSIAAYYISLKLPYSRKVIITITTIQFIKRSFLKEKEEYQCKTELRLSITRCY